MQDINLAIFNSVLLTLLHLLLTWWWDMILEHNAAWWNLCQKWKEILLMLYYIDKNWYHIIKVYLDQFSKFAFQEVAHPLGGQADIFWEFH